MAEHIQNITAFHDSMELAESTTGGLGGSLGKIAGSVERLLEWGCHCCDNNNMSCDLSYRCCLHVKTCFFLHKTPVKL
jgi:hypothetical protein